MDLYKGQAGCAHLTQTGKHVGEAALQRQNSDRIDLYLQGGCCCCHEVATSAYSDGEKHKKRPVYEASRRKTVHCA